MEEPEGAEGTGRGRKGAVASAFTLPWQRQEKRPLYK